MSGRGVRVPLPSAVPRPPPSVVVGPRTLRVLQPVARRLAVRRLPPSAVSRRSPFPAVRRSPPFAVPRRSPFPAVAVAVSRRPPPRPSDVPHVLHFARFAPASWTWGPVAVGLAPQVRPLGGCPTLPVLPALAPPPVVLRFAPSRTRPFGVKPCGCGLQALSGVARGGLSYTVFFPALLRGLAGPRPECEHLFYIIFRVVCQGV